MSTRIFVLCLLSSVISTVAPLKCQACFTSKECRNEDMKMVECGQDEGHCLTISFRSTMIFPSVSFIYKGCAKTEQCSQAYYSVTSIARRYLQKKIDCCGSDGCNTPTLYLPRREDLRPNGLFCPASYEQNGVSYEEGGLIPCLGEEDQCINVNFSINALSVLNATVSVQGCTTKSVCSYPKGKTEAADGLFHYNVMTSECQNGLILEG